MALPLLDCIRFLNLNTKSTTPSQFLRSSSKFLSSHSTSFGFKKVTEEEKPHMVGDLFTKVAANYDLMNDLMSAGLHRLWKHRLVTKLNPSPGITHLDVAAGTGDVSFRIFDSLNYSNRISNVHEDSLIYACDVNPNMLEVGRARANRRGIRAESLVWVEGDAENLNTFKDHSVDSYTIAFGMRNLTHIDRGLAEAFRVLKRGGRFLCLELSHVDLPFFNNIYDFYSFNVIPAMGEIVAGDWDSYQYLVESVRRFPCQEEFGSMIVRAGFRNVEYESLVFGVAAIHSGVKM